MSSPELDLAARYHFAGQDIAWLVALWARKRGDKPFMIWEPGTAGGRTWTYAEFWRDVRQVAAGLHARGLRQGDRLLIHSDNCPEMVIAWYACAILGAIAVTTGTHSTAEELAWFIGQAEPKAAITQPAYVPLFEGHGARLDWLAVMGETDTETPGLSCTAFTALFGREADAPARAPDPMLPAGIVYTSGSTSRPKAVLHSHANFLWAARLLPPLFNFAPDDVHLAQMPFYHLNAQTWTIAVALGVGGAFVLIPRFTAKRYWEYAERHGITHSAVMPILVEGAGPPPPVERLRFKTFTGSGGYADDFAHACGARLFGCYGMSELVAPVLTTSLCDLWERNTLGRPTPGYEVRLVDPDTGALCGPGETGELQVRAARGIQIFCGYFRNEEANAQNFDADGWFRTGDIMRLDPSGDFFYVDRGAFRLKVGGENVSTLEVEQVIAAVPGVREVAVVGRPHTMLSEVAVAFVVASQDRAGLREQIAESCTQRLSKFKRPHAIYLIEELPKLAIAGKIDKVLLKRRAAEMTDAQGGAS